MAIEREKSEIEQTAIGNLKFVKYYLVTDKKQRILLYDISFYPKENTNVYIIDKTYSVLRSLVGWENQFRYQLEIIKLMEQVSKDIQAIIEHYKVTKSDAIRFY